MSATLENEIASAIASETITSAALGALISEVQEAITEADKTAEAEREKALDVLASPDAVKAREAVATIEFSRERLCATLPRLEIKQQEAAAEEFLQRWLQDFATHKAARDTLATEGREFLPGAFTKIADWFSRCASLDIELSRLHQARPSGVAMHLDSAELVARGLESFSRDNPSIARELKLPDFAHSNRMAWPPPAPPLSTILPLPVQPHRGGDWWQDADERAAARQMESERVADFYERQQREREAANNSP